MADDGTAYWIGGWSTTQGGSTSNRGLLRNSNPANPAGTTVVEMGGDVVSGLHAQLDGHRLRVRHLRQRCPLHPLRHLHRRAHDLRHRDRKDNAVVLREGDPTGGGDSWQNWRFVSVNELGQLCRLRRYQRHAR